ncbi:MAG: glycoside hydrolase family 3 N-terminal domain-containing protein [Chloroflexota bacterium]
MRRSAITLGAVVALGLVAGVLLSSLLIAPSTPPKPPPSAGAVVTPTPRASSAATGAPTTVPTDSPPAPSPTTAPTLGQRIGQRLIVAMAGTTPTAELLGRARRGEIGGVILFRRNVTTPDALRRAIDSLQQAAHDGGQPPLLIMADQEGGSIRTIPWAPPALSAHAMGTHPTTWIKAKGAATGKALAAVGVNVDLAPVADVPASTSTFMALAGRAFSTHASRAAADVSSFAAGLRSAGVIAVGKHAPGIGRVARNTDQVAQTVTASKAALETDLAPFRALIKNRIPMLMLSNATYPAYDASNAAGWSRAISVDLLRGTLGFKGVTITDSLDGTGTARRV